MKKNYEMVAELVTDPRAVVLGDAESIEDAIAAVEHRMLFTSKEKGRQLSSFYTHDSCMDKHPCVILIETGKFERRYHIGLRELPEGSVHEIVDKIKTDLGIPYEGHRIHDMR